MSDAERFFFVVRKGFNNGCGAIMSLHISETDVVGFYVFDVTDSRTQKRGES